MKNLRKINKKKGKTMVRISHIILPTFFFSPSPYNALCPRLSNGAVVEYKGKGPDLDYFGSHECF